MQLSRARIKNYRSIKDATVQFGAQTAILGANGSGKSTVIRAIDRFFSNSSAIELDDFYRRDATEPIEIELTFCDLTATQHETFGSRIHNGELRVVRVFEAGKGASKLYGMTLRHEPFETIRQLDGATPKRQAYNLLRGSDPKYASLDAVSNAGQIEEQLEAWEAANGGELALGRDNGQFFGFTNVGMGLLQKAVTFVFIPAVRDASADAVDQKSSVIGRLLELVVKSAVMQRADIVEFQTRASAEFAALTSAENLPELSTLADVLSSGLQNFYLEAGVDLQWRESQGLVVPLPSASVSLTDDGFSSTVDRKGHGLQRAFILTLLHHMAKVTGTPPPADANGAEAELAVIETPTLILGIEEPELYQHPTKQRHFANVLASLSQGGLPGAAGNTQIVFCSHSPLFVSMPRFSEIRIARRVASEPEAPRECVLVASSLEMVADRLAAVYRAAPNTFTAASLLPRLHILGEQLSEGFFAACVVLVEGPGDKAAFYASANLLGARPEAYGIAVLVADGKTSIDRCAIIFSSFGIPTFCLWDCDRGEEHHEHNIVLRRIADPEFQEDAMEPITAIFSRGACFEDSLETTMKAEFGADQFVQYRDAACAEYDMPSNKKSQKSPAVLTKIFELAAAQGAYSPTLLDIVRRVFLMQGVELGPAPEQAQ